MSQRPKGASAGGLELQVQGDRSIQERLPPETGHIGARAGTGGKWARTTLDQGVVQEDAGHPAGPEMRGEGCRRGLNHKGSVKA